MVQIPQGQRVKVGQAQSEYGDPTVRMLRKCEYAQNFIFPLLPHARSLFDRHLAERGWDRLFL